MPKWHRPIDPDKVPQIVVKPPRPKALEGTGSPSCSYSPGGTPWRSPGGLEDVDRNPNVGIAVRHAHPKRPRQAEFLHHRFLAAVRQKC
ncbi:MAG: hypothetical protein ACK4SY_02970 [Pyrobaculum sp.]